MIRPLSEATEGTIRVLHVDDDPDFAELVAAFLQRKVDRLTVLTANHPSAALTILREQEIDCIVSDFDMPVMNGIEFLETVRTDRPHLPFILYTGKGSEEVASEAISAGVTDYLQKSSGSDQYTVLANRITNAVNSHQSREALEKRNRELQRYETIINSMLETACIYDENGRFQTVNNYLAEWYNTTPEELLGTQSNLIPLLREQHDGNPFQELLDGDRDQLQGTIDGEFPGRGYSVLEYRLTPIRNGDTVSGVVGVTRDITAQTKREEALRRSRAEFQELFNGMNDTAWVVGLDGDILAVNDAAVTTLGYSRAELTSMSPQEIDSGLENTEISSLIETMPGDEIQVFETAHRTADGNRIPVEISSSLITYHDEQAILSIARDISTRKRRQRDFETVLDEMDDAVLIHPRDEPFAFVNQAAIDRYGYSRTEFEEMSPLEIAAPEERSEHGERSQSLLESSKAVFETVHLSESGDRIPVEINASTIQFRGEPMILNTVRDISDRKELQREREQIISRVTDAIVEVNSEWQFTLVNEQAEELYDMEASELLGKDFWEIFPTARGTRFEREYRQVMNTRESTEFIEYFSQLDGWFDIKAYPNEEGGIAFYFIDVTEQQKYQQEIEETNQLLSTLFDTLPVGVTVLNSHGTIISANQKAEEVLDLTESSITDRTYSDPDWKIFGEDTEFVPPEDLPFARVMETGDPVINYEHGITVADGANRWLSINASPIPTENSDIEYVVATITDRTEERETKRAIEEQNERLDQFASIVSHDLRNPLTVAQGHLGLARAECESDHFEKIENAHSRMDSLITSLLTLAREGETGTDVTTVVMRDELENWWGNVDTKDATLSITVEKPIRADENRLRQLVENLLRNAVDHGGSTVTVTIGELVDGFFIEDTGPGIPASERDDIFEAGYSTSTGGTGLGLNIVKQIVEAHGWDIHVTEGTSGGARFEITGVESVTANRR